MASTFFPTGLFIVSDEAYEFGLIICLLFCLSAAIEDTALSFALTKHENILTVLCLWRAYSIVH